MKVPKDLQKFVGRKELRYTLKTGYLGVAKQKARFVAAQVQLIFKFLRKGGAVLAKLSDGQIQKLVHQHIKASIKNWDKRFYEEFDLEVDPPPFDNASGLKSYVEALDDIRKDLIVNLNFGDFSMLESPICELLKKNGINNVTKGSLEYRKLCAEICKAEIQLMPMEKQHMLGDFSYKKELSDIFPEVFPKAAERLPQIAEQNSEILEKVLDTFWKESSPHWKPRTKTQFKTCHNHLLKFLGPDQMIHVVGYQIGRDYKKFLSNTKTNRGTRMSPARVDLYLGYAAQVFNWAIKHHYTEVNPFSGLQYGKKKRKRPDKQRDAFSTDDLKKMFSDSRYFGQDKWGKCKHPHFFWIPILGLYTGARMEEIGQLYVDDAKQIDGVWALDINENRPDQSVKTSEQRLVPLHDFIVTDLRFIDYIRSLPQDGRVFPELKRIQDRYTHSYTQWFSSFKKRCGIDANKTFHSFRHSLTTCLLEQDVDDYRIAQLVGHVTDSQTTGRYGKRFKPEMLKEKVVDKIDYGINLNHLKKSKWVPS
jgi:integrase